MVSLDSDFHHQSFFFVHKYRNMEKSTTAAATNHEEISVSIRMRPMNERETSNGLEKIFHCQEEVNAVQQIQYSKGGEIQPVEGQTYYFDKVFDCNSTTTEVYNGVAKDIVKGVVKGINGTIFACKSIYFHTITHNIFDHLFIYYLSV